MSEAFKKYICKTCGLIYDEELGDPDSGLAPGTRFEDIPDDWYCPLCLVSKADFVLVDETKKVADGEVKKTRVSLKPDVLIVGSGYAGWQMAEAIRKEQPDAVISMVTADDGAVYPKPSLSMALSQGRAPADLPEATAQQKATELGVGIKTKTKVMSINTKRKKVMTTGGSFSYQKLILATGANALLPKVGGDAAQEIMTINDLTAYKKFYKKLQSAKQVALIGGGLIATELAEDLAAFGVKVTMLVRGAHLMSQILPPGISQHLETKLQDKGVEIVFNSEVSVMNQADEGYLLSTDQGEDYHADLVLAAIGLSPNIVLAKKAKLETNLGVCIDEHCQTSDEHVYAIGDCAEKSGVVQAYLEPIRRQISAVVSHIAAKEEQAVFELVPTLIKTKTPSLSIMLSPPLKATHGAWQNSVTVGENQKLFYMQGEEVQGFALSGELVTSANDLYRDLIAS